MLHIGPSVFLYSHFIVSSHFIMCALQWKVDLSNILVVSYLCQLEKQVFIWEKVVLTDLVSRMSTPYSFYNLIKFANIFVVNFIVFHVTDTFYSSLITVPPRPQYYMYLYTYMTVKAVITWELCTHCIARHC